MPQWSSFFGGTDRVIKSIDFDGDIVLKRNFYPAAGATRLNTSDVTKIIQCHEPSGFCTGDAVVYDKDKTDICNIKYIDNQGNVLIGRAFKGSPFFTNVDRLQKYELLD